MRSFIVSILLFVLAVGLVKAEEKSTTDVLKKYFSKNKLMVQLLHDKNDKKITRKEYKKKKKEISKEIKPLENEVKSRLKEYFPSSKEEYGSFTWSIQSLGSQITLEAKDTNNNKSMGVILVYYSEDDKKPEAKSFKKKCNGYPAKRFTGGKAAHILINNIQLQIQLWTKELQSEETLDKVVKSFDLKGLEKL
jgi:hypothetical protein